MTDNIIKILAEQSGFDNSGNKQVVDIRIEEGENINLAESYIAVDIAAETSCNANADAVYDNFIEFKDGNRDTNRHDPVILVKHATARGSRSGMIESLRNIDVLNAALARYNKNHNERQELNGFSSQNARSLRKTQPQNEIYGEGNEVSRKRNHEVRIPLKDIFNFCNTENYDSVKHGALHLHFELNLDKVAVGNYTNDFNGKAKPFANTAAKNYDDCDNVTQAAGATISKLITTLEYVDLIDSPWWVGAPVIVSRNFEGGGVAPAPGGTRIVTAINYQKAADGQPVDSNKLELTLSSPWSVGDGDYTEIKCELDGTETGTTTINKVELTAVVNRVDIVRNQPLVYSTFVSQEDSYPAVNEIQRNYDIPAFTKNIYVAFNSNKISHDANLANYRISADGEYLTGSRQVKPHSPKHFEFISAVYKNNAKSLHNLGDQVNEINHSRSNAAQSPVSTVILAIPVKFLPRPQKVTLELFAGAALGGKHILYSEVIRQVE